MALLHVMHVLFNLRTGGLEMQVVNVIDHSDRTRFRHSICCLEPERRELARSDKLQKRFGESARDIAVRECSLEVAVRRHKAMYEGAARRKRA